MINGLFFSNCLFVSTWLLKHVSLTRYKINSLCIKHSFSCIKVNFKFHNEKTILKIKLTTKLRTRHDWYWPCNHRTSTGQGYTNCSHNETGRCGMGGNLKRKKLLPLVRLPRHLITYFVFTFTVTWLTRVWVYRVSVKKPQMFICMVKTFAICWDTL